MRPTQIVRHEHPRETVRGAGFVSARLVKLGNSEGFKMVR